MGFFAFGDTKKENLTSRGREIVEAAPEEIQNALTADGMFFCSHYLCSMQERHCITYQKKATQGFQPGQVTLYRPECENCIQGREIARKNHITIPKKKNDKKCIGCGKVLPLSDFYFVDSRDKHSARCIPCHTEFTQQYTNRVFDAV